MKRIIYILLLCLAVLSAKAGQDTPVRLGIIGLTHSHVGGVLNDKNKPYVIAGIVEPDKQLAERMSKRFGFSMEIVYSTMQELYDQQHPEAVACFNATYYHQDVVRFFAPKRFTSWSRNRWLRIVEQAQRDGGTRLPARNTPADQL